jgi:hypothetical protein
MECKVSGRARALIGVTREISEHKLDLVGVQEVIWDRAE